VRHFVLAGTLAVSSWVCAAGTLDDMELRSNFEAAVRGTAQTAQLHLKIQVENSVAMPQGEVHDLNEADAVVELATKVNGITAVDRSGFRFAFPAASDDALASLVARTLFESPRYSASTMQVGAKNGIVTLTGTLTNASWRTELRKVCGALDGVVDVVDRLETPDTPDEKIQKALDHVFGARAVPRFPGRVKASVKDGVVRFEGHVPRLFDKRLADHDALGINGVRRIDNQLVLDAGKTIQVVNP
jgi:osmotically-inducible protein OsmY